MKIIRFICLINIDIIICILSLYLSYSLVYQKFVPFFSINLIDYIISSFLLISIFFISKVYFYRSRFLPNDVLSFYFKYFLLYLIIFFTLNHFLLNFINDFFESKMFYGNNIPRSVIIINSVLVFLFVILTRKLIEFLVFIKNSYIQSINNKKILISSNPNTKKKLKVCIFGAGSLGNLTLEFLYKFKKDIVIDCFFDDDENLHGQIIKGIKIRSLEKEIDKNKSYNNHILYISIKNLEQYKIDLINNTYSKYFESIVYLSDELGNLKINALHNEAFNKDINKIIPTTNYIKELENNKILFKNKNIIITGCAGSIGKELVMQILNYGPKNLYLIDKNEHQLFELENYIEMLGLKKISNIKFVLVNLADNNFKKFLNFKNVDIIFHAAAYKHVNMAEKNIKSVLYNNIISTYNLCKYSSENNIKNFVNVSTDKAVNPKSTMGLSKRICELIVSKSANENNFYSVRFGNVLNSSGSVIPIFSRQIENDQKITLTDLEATRYFMSIPEAISLILLSYNLKKKNNNIFILDMGKPIKIFDIAKRLCKIYNKNLVSDKKVLNDIEFVVTGLRDGEKLHEELYIGSQEIIRTEIKKIFKIEDKDIKLDISIFIAKFRDLVENNSEDDLKNFLSSKV